MTSSPDPNRVELSVPARTEYLQLVRLNVAGVAGTLSFTVEEIEDLKIAVEELAAAVLGLPDGGLELSVAFDLEPRSLTVTGERTCRPGAVMAANELLTTILDAMVDRHWLEIVDDTARFGFEKTGGGG